MAMLPDSPVLRAALHVGACALMLAGSALAQEPQPPSPAPGQAAPFQAPGPPPTQAPGDTGTNPGSNPSAFKPGFIDAIGRWLEEGASKLKSGVQGAREQVDQFGSKARESASFCHDRRASHGVPKRG